MRPTVLSYQGYEFFIYKYLRKGLTIREASMEWLEDRHKIALEGLVLEGLGDRTTLAGLHRRLATTEKQMKRMFFASTVTSQQLMGCLARFYRGAGSSAMPSAAVGGECE